MITSLETIFFQNKSKMSDFAKKMSQIFQDTINVRNDIITSDAARIKAVETYVVNTAGPRLVKLIKEYTGISLTLMLTKQLYLNFAIALTFGDDFASVIESRNNYSGAPSNAWDKFLRYGWNYKLKTAKELEEFSKSLSLKDGKVKAAILEKFNLKGYLIFDLYSGFLIKETGARACDPLSADELTSIILHELGHATCFIEHAADGYYRREIMSYAVSQFAEQSSMIEKLNYIKAIGASLGLNIDKAIDNLIKTLHTNTIDHAEGSVFYSCLRILLSTALVIASKIPFMNINYLLHSSLSTTIFKSLRHIVTDLKRQYTSLNNVKESDYDKLIKGNIQYDEKLADEFVVRHGLGAELGTALDKLISWSHITGVGDMWMKQYDSASFYGRLLPWALYTIMYGEPEDEHPGSIKRLKYLIDDTMKAFRDPSVPNAALAAYYESYLSLKKAIEHPSGEQQFSTMCTLLLRAIDYIITIPINIVVSGRYEQEYQNLYDTVQSLINNEMYAVMYKLKH